MSHRKTCKFVTRIPSNARGDMSFTREKIVIF